jgi:signal transduction histidine kinase
MMPLVGLFFFRVYENQLIRQTESELIAQSAVIASVYAGEVRKAGFLPEQLGAALPMSVSSSERYHPVEPSLDLAADLIGPRRPDSMPPAAPADPAFAVIGRMLDPVLAQTQDVTLAGFRVLDPNGIVIAGRDELGLSLAHVEEVARALTGNYVSVLRQRVSDEPPPPLYSISRGTKVRVFTAFPIVVDGRVAGVVYASRTPSNIVKHFYQERGKLVLALAAVLTGAMLLGFLVTRTLTGPLQELTERTRRIAAGDREAAGPLAHHGTSEIAELSQGLLAMAQKLHDRSDQVSTFATHVSHELKSPLTAIHGAAELLRDSGDTMSADERQRFLGNIISDTARLDLLVRRLMELAKAKGLSADGAETTVAQALAALDLRAANPVRISGELAAIVAISAQNLAAVLGNLISNALRHGASEVQVNIGTESGFAAIGVSDNGAGISPNNAARIFDPFFTTARDEGGTGMGLGIVKAMLEAHGGTICLAPSSQGASFAITIPLAS